MKLKKVKKSKPKTKPKKAVKAKKPIGAVTHYFGGISVAIIKFKKPVKVGETILFKGATTDFKEKIKSMQYDHEDIKVAKKNKEVGLKVGKRVREGDEIFQGE